MAITRMTIMKASSDSDYRRGQDIFLIDKRIADFEIDMNPFTNTPMIMASVSDADGTVNEVEVSIDEDESQIIGSFCSCPDFYSTDGLCRHCVAVLLKYISRRHIQSSGRVIPNRNERIGQSMIESYIQRDTSSHPDQSVTGMIELEPILHQEYSKLSVEFKIGAKKKYVVKDLLELARLVREHELFEYGKNLKFYHEREAFSESSRPLLDFIIRRAEEYEYHFQYVQENSYSFRTMKALRFLPLSPSAIDDFLSLMTGRTMQFQFKKQMLNIRIVDGDPELELKLSQDNAMSYRLAIESCHSIAGAHTFWLLKNKILYHCTPDFTKDMKIFLCEMERQQTDTLLLSEKQMIP
ncbi:MAG: SNF2 helicase associated domain-containing protein, partial [Coprococcus sp.]